jgi:hypothetical protein
MLTEDQIERRVEYKVNCLDDCFMAGQLTQAEYDAEMRSIDDWARRENRFSRAASRILDMEMQS